MFNLGIQAVWPETWGWLIEFRDGRLWSKDGTTIWHSSNHGIACGTSADSICPYPYLKEHQNNGRNALWYSSSDGTHSGRSARTICTCGAAFFDTCGD